jgi:dTDP-4-dehydrorhamnose 3,5-epimerase
VLSETAHVQYKCTELYDREDEIAIVWNDPGIGIEWPMENPLLSPKDAAAPTLETLAEILHERPSYGKNDL